MKVKKQKLLVDLTYGYVMWKYDITKNDKISRSGTKLKSINLQEKHITNNTNKNLFEGHEVCFKVSGAFGNKLLQHFQLDNFPRDCLQEHKQKYYLKGVVGECVTKMAICIKFIGIILD